ncbi:hypothetical protein MKY09_05210 [Psychrobacillus sp. FSL K6-4046]|uniref:hypothetical protein n=1 Tax=Psychrobacillus sp. FSL K6-4046 TaxID=2921550 RepID=UPI00315A07DF
MMIHTAHLFIELTPEHVYHKDSNHGKWMSFNQIMKLNNFIGISARQYKSHGVYRCSIIIDVTKILNSGFIVEADYWRIKRFVKLSLKMVYGDESLYDHHNLIRIDYRIDRKVPKAIDRELYLLLYNKTKSNFKRLKKQNNYKTTIYHSCKSIQTTIYDKNEHCKYQNREPMEWERDMIRFEIRLKNPHIYNRVKGTGEIKCLYSFFKIDVFQEYVQKYLLQIFPSGDFYCYDLAEELISSSKYSLTVRRRLKHFLGKVSKGNLDTPLNKFYPDSIKKDAYNKRLQNFKELNLNPITIPQAYKIDKLPSLLDITCLQM